MNKYIAYAMGGRALFEVEAEDEARALRKAIRQDSRVAFVELKDGKNV